MTELLSARVDGIPGPKGSLTAFCMAACCRGRRPQVVVKEQSEVGAAFRKLVARKLKLLKWEKPIEGPISTIITVYVPRKYSKDGKVWPSHDTAYPVHRNSGDIEKHARTVHDALMDAGIIADDSQVWFTTLCKKWADAENPPGVEVMIGG